MKKIYTLILIATLAQNSIAQNLLLNGSFETNTATANQYSIQGTWNAVVANSWEVDGGTMDLLDSVACGTASNGNWWVRTETGSGLWPYLSFSLAPSYPFLPGYGYKLTFDKRYCGPNTSAIDIGLSNDSTLMGTIVHTSAAPLSGAWAGDTFVWSNTATYKFITVNIGITGGTGGVGLDNFVLETTTGTPELKTDAVKIFPNPAQSYFVFHYPAFETVNGQVEITDITGRRLKTFSEQPANSRFNVSDLAEGIYFVKIQSLNVNEKLIVVR